MTKDRCDRGKISLRRFLQSFKAGDKVALLAEPSYQRGMHPLRMQGQIGEVRARRGKVYEVLASDKGKMKCFLVHPVHMRRMQ